MDSKHQNVWLYILGWPFAGGAVFASLGAAVSVAAINQFQLGSGLFLAGAAMMVAHWFVSDPVSQKKAELQRLSTAARYKFLREKAKRSYLTVLLGGIIVILILLMACLYWTYRTRMNYEAESVLSGLDMQFHTQDGDIFKSLVTITNDSNFDISDTHQISCGVHRVVVEGGLPFLTDVTFLQVPPDKWLFSGTPASAIVPERLGRGEIKAHKDSESSFCLSNFKSTLHILCADVTVYFSYLLTNQLAVQKKPLRFIFNPQRTGYSEWQKQPVESDIDYCYSSLSEEGKRKLMQRPPQ